MRPSPYPSLKDVAATAGVSFQTASKVLNSQTGVVSAATRDRIEAAARELGYVPNALARGLVRRTSLTIGILTDDFSDAAFAQFVVAAQRRAAAAGHTALVASTRSGDALQPLRKLREHRIDGLLVVAPSLEHDGRVGPDIGTVLPTVSLHHLPGAKVPLVGSDHRHTGAAAAEHLLSLGHVRVATVTGPRPHEVVSSRHAGFRDTFRRAGHRIERRCVVACEWSADDAYRATRRLQDRLRRRGDLPLTAIFAHSDTIAVGVLAALLDAGIRVPQDCSVIACDDLPIAAFTAPPLTTVRVPFRQTGARAVEVLLARIAGAAVPARTLLPTELVVRSSTAPPPGPGPRHPGPGPGDASGRPPPSGPRGCRSR